MKFESVKITVNDIEMKVSFDWEPGYKNVVINNKTIRYGTPETVKIYKITVFDYEATWLLDADFYIADGEIELVSHIKKICSDCAYNFLDKETR